MSKNRYTVLHGMHEQRTEKMQLAKVQREIEDRRKTIMREMESHVNELDKK